VQILVISNNVIVGPKSLRYPAGQMQATVTASIEGTNTILRIDYGAVISTL